MRKNGKMPVEEFVRRAVENLRTQHSRGIHSVFSGFNAAFRQYYDGADPVQAVKALEEKGLVVTRPVKGGVMIYLSHEAPSTANKALEKILGS